MPPATEELADFIAGFAAAEGGFVQAGDPPTFTFAVQLGAVDAGMCFELCRYFGVGHVHWYPRRKAHYDDEATFTVRALRDLVEVIVPFMDAHLWPSYKRQQYETWRAALLEYRENGAKRRRPCAEPGCGKPRRAKGLCRHHYYLEFRR